VPDEAAVQSAPALPEAAKVAGRWVTGSLQGRERWVMDLASSKPPRAEGEARHRRFAYAMSLRPAATLEGSGELEWLN